MILNPHKIAISEMQESLLNFEGNLIEKKENFQNNDVRCRAK